MSYTNGDDPHLDAEVEGALARRTGTPFKDNPYQSLDDNPKITASWSNGWVDEDLKMKRPSTELGLPDRRDR